MNSNTSKGKTENECIRNRKGRNQQPRNNANDGPEWRKNNSNQPLGSNRNNNNSPFLKKPLYGNTYCANSCVFVDIPRFNFSLMKSRGGYSISRCEQDNSSLISTALVHGWRESLQNVISNHQQREGFNTSSKLFLLGPRYPSETSSMNKGMGDDCQFMVTGSVDTKTKPDESFREAALRELQEECGLRVVDDSKFSEVLESKIITTRYVYHYNINFTDLEHNNKAFVPSQQCDLQFQHSHIDTSKYSVDIGLSVHVTVKSGKIYHVDCIVKYGENPNEVALRALISELNMVPKANIKLEHRKVEKKISESWSFIVNIKDCICSLQTNSLSENHAMTQTMQSTSTEKVNNTNVIGKRKVNVIVYGTLNDFTEIFQQSNVSLPDVSLQNGASVQSSVSQCQSIPLKSHLDCSLTWIKKKSDGISGYSLLNFNDIISNVMDHKEFLIYSEGRAFIMNNHVEKYQENGNDNDESIIINIQNISDNIVTNEEIDLKLEQICNILDTNKLI